MADAQAGLAADDIADTGAAFNALINEVRALSGHSIPAATATALIASAQRIRSVLAC